MNKPKCNRPAGRVLHLRIVLLFFQFGALALVLLLWHGPAIAQGNNTLSPEGINNLVRSLESLQEGIGSGLLTQPDSELDRARQQAAKELGFDSENPQSGDRTQVRDRLSISQRILVARFCAGEAELQDELLLRSTRAFSKLEQEYCRRAGEALFQYGYETFDGRLAPDFLLNGAISETYRLGRGDELVISFRGREARTITTRVDREGRVILPDFEPLAAAGLTYGEFREQLVRATRATFIGTDVFVSLGSIRRIGVLVAGEVALPGVQLLTSETSLLDALGLAGGILKSGSLRRIQVISGAQSRNVDLYELLAGNGGVANFVLNDGDRVVVPTMGPSIAVAGDVAKPGIFELAPGQSSLSLEGVIGLAGGSLRPRGNRMTIIRASALGGQEIVAVSSESDSGLQAGDLLIVGPRNTIDRGGIILSGNVRLPGRRALTENSTIYQLIDGGDALLPRSYMLVAALETSDSASGSEGLFPIDLGRILSREEDFVLKEGDRLTVFSQRDVAFLYAAAVQRVLQLHDISDPGLKPSRINNGDNQSSTSEPRVPQIENLQSILRQLESARPADTEGRSRLTEATQFLAGCKSVENLDDLLKVSGARSRFQHASFIPPSESRSEARVNNRCPEVFESNVGFLPFLLEFGVVIRGEVREPGVYPVVDNTPLRNVLSAAGGVTRTANAIELELSSASPERRGAMDPLTSSISPGDVLRVTLVFSDADGGQVQVIGEFVQSGTYSIRRGERLSQLIARAGGLTRQAYPFGAIFTRASVKAAEEQSLRRLARELNASVTVAAANRGIDPSAIAAFANLTRDIADSPASGRVVTEADPTVLSVRPELDIVLRDGDKIFMPKRPNSVLVTGDVLNPGAMQFISGRNVADYVRQAGGFQQSADKNRIFIVLPNGVARPVKVSPFNFSSVDIPPGSSIIVPKDATPFNVLTIARELSSVLSQLAITAASLAVIGNN